MRVWISFLKAGDKVSIPWYQDEKNPALSKFVFRVALVHQKFSQSITFYPRPAGHVQQTGERRERIPERPEAEEKAGLARRITDIYQQMLSNSSGGYFTP